MKKVLFYCLLISLLILSPLPIFSLHNPGKDCFSCHGHNKYKIGGTVYTDKSGTTVKSGVPFTLIKPDGTAIYIGNTNEDGNFVSDTTPEDGKYLIIIQNRRSRTWHIFPDQKSCNSCHNKDTVNAYPIKKKFPEKHTTVPSDNKCSNCHYFPQSASLNNLIPSGILDGSQKVVWSYESPVMFLSKDYWVFTPLNEKITSVRPDIFSDGFFSIFDIILYVAEKEKIPLEYYYDDSCKTHFITKINNIEGNYWYQYNFGGPDSNGIVRLAFKPYNRWDEVLWRDKNAIRIINYDNLDKIKQEFRDEIIRENDSGHIIPLVRFSINPSDFKGNPPGSGRIKVNKDFQNVHVTPHNLRSAGYPSIYSKPFKPGVVTSIDIPLSLLDQDSLTVVTGVYNDNNYGTDIVELGFPQEGIAHASGFHGIDNLTEDGFIDSLSINKDYIPYIPGDLIVVHAQDFSYWKWYERGNPYFEISDPSTDVEDEQIINDFSFDKGFQLYNPYPNPFINSIKIKFNVIEPDHFNLSVYNLRGELVKTIYESKIGNIGLHELIWYADDLSNGQYFIILKNSKSVQGKFVVNLK